MKTTSVKTHKRMRKNGVSVVRKHSRSKKGVAYPMHGPKVAHGKNGSMTTPKYAGVQPSVKKVSSVKRPSVGTTA